jgi:DNA invertase Pin-like site-specific DNA recombinase
MDYGYMRVSTKEQDHELQFNALVKKGIDPSNIYKDTLTGKTTTREGLDTVLGLLKKGDSLTVWKLDRLGRNTRHLHNVVGDLMERGVAFRTVEDNFDTTHMTGKLLFTILAGLAEFERETIRLRVSAGMQAASRGGKKMGRKPLYAALDPEIDRLLDTTDATVREIAEYVGVSKSLVQKRKGMRG